MILTDIDQWIEGNFCYDGYGDQDEHGVAIHGTGPGYFIGSATLSEDAPIVAIGAVKVPEGWLLFAQDPAHADPSFCLSAHASDGTDLFAVMTIDTGWEPDVISAALERHKGVITQIMGDASTDEAKRALHDWVRSLEDRWPKRSAQNPNELQD